MCGLLGYLGKSVKNEKLEQATLKISHRGPDNFKVVSLNNAFLGFQRLSIMDLLVPVTSHLQTIPRASLLCAMEKFLITNNLKHLFRKLF